MSYFSERAGAFELTSVENLPNCHVAYPGERWSDAIASGQLIPGQPVVVVASGAAPTAREAVRLAEAGDEAADILLATRTIDVPDPNTGPTSMSPNEVRNQAIESGDWVLCQKSGVFILTLVTPDEYKPGDKIGWDLDGELPSGKAGTGAWAKNENADIENVFRVREWKEVNSTTHEGYLTVEFIGRNQF